MHAPFQLNCEYAVDPVGIDVRHPRFSWLLRSDERSQMQSAYRIWVASSKEKPAKNPTMIDFLACSFSSNAREATIASKIATKM